MATALITGGNRGIGLETGRQLAARGWTVLLGARKLAEGEAAARGLAEGARAVALDVTDASSVAALARRLEAEDVRLDALVNNAGVYRVRGAGAARATMDVNFHGPLRVTDTLRRRLARGANVVMVTSGLGELSGFPAALRREIGAPDLDRAGLVALADRFLAGERGWPDPYAVSKALLNAMTRVLARELAADGVRVNAVCPGWVRTDMGGSGAPRTVEEGASGVVWAAALGEGAPTGGVFRDGEAVVW